MKEDESPDPIPVARLGADGIVLKAHHLADLVQQLEPGIGNETLGGFCAFGVSISGSIPVTKTY